MYLCLCIYIHISSSFTSPFPSLHFRPCPLLFSPPPFIIHHHHLLLLLLLLLLLTPTHCPGTESTTRAADLAHARLREQATPALAR